MNSFFRFLEPSFLFPKEVILAFLLGATWSFYIWLGIYLFRETIPLLQVKDFSAAADLLLIYIIVFVFYWIIRYFLRNAFWPILEAKLRNSLFRQYYTKFLLSDISQTEKIGTGKWVKYFSDNLPEWYKQLSYTWTFFGYISCFLLFATYMFFSLSWYFGLFFLGIFFISIASLFFFTRRVISLRKERETLQIADSRNIIRLLMSKIDILGHGKMNIEIDKEFAHLSKIDLLNLKLNQNHFFTFGFPEFLSGIVRILLYIGVIYQVFSQFDLSIFLTTLLVLSLYESVVSRWIEWYREYFRSLPKIESFFEVFDGLHPLSHYTDGDEFPGISHSITLSDIDFSYSSGSKVFSSFSTSFPAKEVIALVGPSGGGKSTLLKLLVGLLEPDSGNICIDGKYLSKMSKMSYFSRIGYLTQDPAIFDGTIYENLIYGLPVGKEVDEKDISQALESAGCQFIYNFPQGLSTEIGERGILLSGGQRQRLAIAKIFLKNPDIIFLDEPTSALDSISEEIISRSLELLFQNKTVFIIAHRLQTVRKAHDILYIENGEVVERGNHETLLEKNGKYARMLELQSGI